MEPWTRDATTRGTLAISAASSPPLDDSAGSWLVGILAAMDL